MGGGPVDQTLCLGPAVCLEILVPCPPPVLNKRTQGQSTFFLPLSDHRNKVGVAPRLQEGPPTTKFWIRSRPLLGVENPGPFCCVGRIWMSALCWENLDERSVLGESG